ILQSRKGRELDELLAYRQVLDLLELGLRDRRNLGDPVRLIMIKRACQREEALGAVAPRDEVGGKVEPVEQIWPEFPAHLTRLHIFIDEDWNALLIELAAVGAGQRADLDQLHLGVGIAH